MSSDLEVDVLAEVVEQLGCGLSGSALLDEAERRLGKQLTGNAIIWFALDRRPGNFGLARDLLRGRWLVSDPQAVDSAMAEILSGTGSSTD